MRRTQNATPDCPTSRRYMHSDTSHFWLSIDLCVFAAILLRHVGRKRIVANLVLGIEQPEVLLVRVVMQGLYGPQS